MLLASRRVPMSFHSNRRSMFRPLILCLATLVLIGMMFVPMSSSENGPDEVIRTSTRSDSVEFLNKTTDKGLTNCKGNYYQWVDYNDDGYIDLMARGTKLFENNGAPTYDFTDVTASIGLSGGFTTGCWGDYDNDGDIDLYSCASKGNQDRLWQNQGAPSYNFIDVTVAAGNPSTTDPSTAAAWGDYDRDGYLDLYVVDGEDWNGGNPIYYADKLYHNEGDGTFTDVTVSAGMDTSSHPIYGRGVQWSDFDNDGWLDAYVSNYRIEPNYLWRNNRDGTFTDVAHEYDVAGIGRNSNGFSPGQYYGHTIGSSLGDYNNDQNMDIFTANLVHKDPTRGKFCDDSKFYENHGGPFYGFTDVRSQLGIPTYPVGGTGFDPHDGGTYYLDELFSNICFGDYDNDGWLDFYMPQVYDFPWTDCFLYRNNGNGTFTDVHDAKDIHTHNGYAGAWADHDNDGDLDLITYGKYPEHTAMETRFFVNNGTGNHWLHLNLTGDGVDNNLDAYGARATISYNGMAQVRDVTSGSGSHSTQESKVLEFGLGGHSGPVDLEIWWPDGKVQNMTISQVDRKVNITEPADGHVITELNASSKFIAGRYHVFDEDEVITFDATVTGTPAIYEWDLDNDGVLDIIGTTSTIDWAVGIPGRYTPRLTVWDASRTIGSRQTVVVEIENVAPVVNVSYPVTVYETHPFTLSGNLTQDTPSDLANMTYQWEFHNGSTSAWTTEMDIELSYAVKGDYNFKLKVKDDQDQEDEIAFTVSVVNMLPETWITNSNYTFIEDETITFTGSGNDTINDFDMLVYSWDFDDGTISSWNSDPNTTYSFPDQGPYNVTLFIKDIDGDITNDSKVFTILNSDPVIDDIDGPLTGWEDSSIKFDGEASDTFTDNFSLEYMWTFGDGEASTWSTSSSKSHKYTESGTFTAYLFVRDDDGAMVNGSVNVTVNNPAPTALLPDGDATRYLKEADLLEVTGAGTDTTSDQALLEFSWDFGDGNVTEWSTASTASHNYHRSGNFDVVLRVRDDDLDEGNISFKVVVENVEPELTNVNNQPKTMEVDWVVEFGMTATDTNNDLDGLNYTWTIDGETYFGEDVEYTFTSGGTKSITAKVTDDDGAFESETFTVSPNNPAPRAVLTANRTTIYVGESINFNATATDNPSDLDILTYSWDFGSGTDSAGSSTMVHTFDAVGNYTVKVYVKDDEGATGMATVTVTVVARATDPVDGEEGTEVSGDPPSYVYMIIIIPVLLLLALIGGAIFLITQKGPTQELPPPEPEEEPVEEDISEGEVDKEEKPKKKDKSSKGKKKGKKKQKAPAEEETEELPEEDALKEDGPDEETPDDAPDPEDEGEDDLPDDSDEDEEMGEEE